MNFLNNLAVQTNLTFTENGAVTNQSSQDAVVDFFALGGAMRDTPEKAADLFEAAYRQQPLTAIRTLFYLRDVRGGQGEREVFRASMRRLAGYGYNDPYFGKLDDPIYQRVAHHIPFYGRWDDLFYSGVTPSTVKLIREQFSHDLNALGSGMSVSLMAKWLPSENASSKKTKNLGAGIRRALGCTPREYRVTLSTLRSHIRLLEQDMSSNNWEGIDYSKLPSQAHRRHVKAFQRHTPERYQDYLDSVEKGEQKINVKSVYPYEIYDMVHKGQASYANVAWENLPDYTRGNNALVMADVSGSMYGRPMSVSVSLALYFAERNRGAFKNHFMTFSAEPQLVRVTGRTLSDKMSSIETAAWGVNTNLQAAFRAILNAARGCPEDVPETLYIISDMEFDAVITSRNQQRLEQRFNWVTGRIEQRVVSIELPSDTLFETAKREFAQAGMKLPHVVFWNVNARQAQAPALAHDGNVSLVSGLSATIFSQAVEGKTPLQLVDEVVNSERYQRITL